MPEPQPSGGFRWTQEPWGAALRCMPLLAAADHLFTVKNLALRDRADEWRAVAGALGVATDDLLVIRQVHDAHVAIASVDRETPWQTPEADVIASNDATAAIAVRVADCVPILLAEETGRAVAAVHAGWRGTMKRVGMAGVAALQERFGVRPERVVAAIGPSIGPCCYEVGDNTREAFREAGHHTSMIGRWFSRGPDNKFHLDLWQATRDQLEGAGVRPQNIHAANLCTKTHADFFHSYRHAGGAAGRMAAAIRANPRRRPV